MNESTKSSISPYFIGAGIGVLNAFAFASAKRGIGVSTAFENFAANIAKMIAPDLTGVNAYVKEREEAPKTDWESFLVLGIPFGSYVASRIAGAKDSPVIAPVWSKSFGPSRSKRYAGAFIGGSILMIGARLAKGARIWCNLAAR